MSLSRITTGLHWLWHQLVVWGLILLVLLAVYVGLGRQLMPLVANYKPELEACLSQEAGLPIRIGRLEGVWEGLSPRFVAHDIRLHNPHKAEQVLLHLPELSTRPALVASLWNGEPRLITTLRGLHITLLQEADGELKLQELASLDAKDPEAARQAVAFVLRQPALELRETAIGLRLRGQKPLLLQGLELSGINEDAEHWLSGQGRLAGASQALRLILHYTGDPLDWRQGRLQAYLELPDLDLGELWTPAGQRRDWALERALGGGTFWLDFAQGQLLSVTAMPRIRELSLRARLYGQRPAQRIQAQGLHGLLHWQREAGGWQFAADRLQGQINGLPLPAPRFALRQQGDRLDVAAARLALAPLWALLPQVAELPEAPAGWLQAARPSGWLPHVHLSLRREEGGSWGQPQVAAEFKALQLQSTKTLPGIANLAGWLRLNASGGLVHIDTRDAVVDLHTLFREPLRASRLQGGLSLRHADGVWALQSGPITVQNEDGRGVARFAFFRPDRAPEAASLHLLAGLRQGRAAAAYRYVPWPAAGDKTLAWLKSAITAGEVGQGAFLYDGPIHARPGHPAGKLQMRFQLKDGRLAYDPEWPAVEALQGEVLIDGMALSVDAPSARVYDSQASAVTAQIPNLMKPVLEVSASVRGQAQDVMRLFRESALRRDLGALNAALQAGGPVNGRLNLKIPILGGQPRVSVQAELPGNSLKLLQQDLNVEELRGALSYSSEQGLSSPLLQGRLLGEAVQARIQSQVRGRSLQQVQVSVDGSVGVPALAAWTPSPLLRHLDGHTAYQADIHIPVDSRRQGQFSLSSNLVGLRLKLPQPLGKGLEPVPSRFVMDLGGKENYGRLVVGKRFNVGLLWRGAALERALLRVGVDGVAWPSAPGLSIEARFPHLELADWQGWVRSAGGGSAGDMLALSRVDVQARELVAGPYLLRNAQIGAQREGSAWQVNVSSERLAAQAKLNLSGREANEVHIERLLWPLRTVSAESQAVSPTLGANLQPWLPMDIHLKSLRLERWPAMPALSASARLIAGPAGLRAEELALSNSALSFRGSADWQWRGAHETRISGQLQSPDVARVLSAFAYAPSMSSEKAEAQVELAWPGAPEAFALDKLNGELTLNLEQGRLLNVSVATAASRVFGLLDIDNLRRRLRLDFSDVTRRGLAYDKARLEAKLNDGVLNPAQFTLKGPSLTATGEGKVDLVRGQLDQELSVTVPMSTAVPVAAAVVGGPLLGGAVVAAEKVLDKQLGRLTTLHYHITGPLDDPKVERRNGWSKP